jgi:anti-sigma B factor antagonist
MTIRERWYDEVVVLDVQGRLSATDSSRPVRTAVEALVRDGHSRIILNMARVPYMASTGLADVVEAFHAARRAGGALKLAHLTRRVRELLAVAAVLNILETFDSEAEAVASFGSVPSLEKCRIVVDGVNDPVLVARLERAIRAALSRVDLRRSWTVRVAPASTEDEKWILTVESARVDDEESLASERDAVRDMAEDVVRAFPSLMAALNAATTIV